MCQPHKMVKHTQTIRRQIADVLPNCLSVFDHIVGLAHTGLKISSHAISQKCGFP